MLQVRLSTVWLTAICTALFLLVCGSSAVAKTVIHHNALTGLKDELMLEILKTAVRQVEPGAEFVAAKEFTPPGRQEVEILNGKLSVVWGSSSPKRESKFRAVRIPALKGLLGHRLFIIHKDNQHKFNNIRNLEDLKRLKAGQGRTWGDTQILKAAGLPVVTASRTAHLIHMTDGQRFDYFPRGIHEPWVEVANNPELDLTIEKKLMLVYPLVMHFYLAPDNTKLHDLIYSGLEKAMLNGAYDEMFFAHPMVRDALNKANVKDRTVIRINNPNLHPDEPMDREEFWLDLFDEDVKI